MPLGPRLRIPDAPSLSINGFRWTRNEKLADEPPTVADRRYDGLVGGIAEYLYKRSNLGRCKLDPLGNIEAATAPSTILRMVPLPRCAEEDAVGAIRGERKVP